MIALPAGKYTEIVGQYIMDKTGMELTPGMYQAFMVINDNKDFVAGVVVTNFRRTDCEMSGASETPAAWRPHVCRAIFSYIFEQLGCVRVTSITTKGNKKARAFLESLGFQLEGNVRLGYDGRRDALIYGLLKAECRYLAAEEGGSLNGQEVRASGPSGTGPLRDSGGAGGDEQRDCDYAGEPEPDRSGDAPRRSNVLH